MGILQKNHRIWCMGTTKSRTSLTLQSISRCMDSFPLVLQPCKSCSPSMLQAIHFKIQMQKRQTAKPVNEPVSS